MCSTGCSVHSHRWSIAQCLCGEIDLDGEQYCANAGNWYCVSHDYANQVNETYEKPPCFDSGRLPECEKGEIEKEYNERLAASNENYLLMDAKTITYGYARSGIELCDVLDGNDTFIHVKHYSSSAPLSHLFNQGLNSADLVLHDSAFVEKANAKILARAGGSGHAISVGNVKRVIYAIICENPSNPPRIPFFSRISYNAAARRLRQMGVECLICAIHRPKIDPHGRETVAA